MTINLHDDHYDFQIVLGKAERERFEAIKHEFPLKIQELYDRERTLHDGKWLLIRVADMETLEAVKKLILIKKKPNRKPFHQDGYGLCAPLICLHTKQLDACFDCEKYPCTYATVGYRKLEHRSISDDDVTWAILPYVPYQYEGSCEANDVCNLHFWA